MADNQTQANTGPDQSQARGSITETNPVAPVQTDVKETLNKHLDRRPSQMELEQNNILKGDADAIAARQRQIRESIARSMIDRPDPNQFREHNNVAPALAGAAYELQNQLRVQSDRNDISVLQGPHSSQAPALQPAGYALSQKLANRPSLQQVQQTSVLGASQRIEENQQAFAQQFANRKSHAEVQQQYNPHSHMASAIQGAAHDLSSQLASRAGPQQANFAHHQQAHAIQGAAYDLNKALNRRMSRDDIQHIFTTGHAQDAQKNSQLQDFLAQRGAAPTQYMPAHHVSPGIQGASASIAQAMQSRPDQSQVNKYFHEDAHRQAASLQGASHAISKKIGARPSRADLEANNILGRFGMATNMDSRRKDFENKFASRKSEFEIDPSIFQDQSHIKHEDWSKHNFRRASNIMESLIGNRKAEHEINQRIFEQAHFEEQKKGRRKSEDYNSFEDAWEKQFTTNRPEIHEINPRIFQQPDLKHSAASHAIGNHLKRRPSQAQVSDMGYLKYGNMDSSIRAAADAISSHIGRGANFQDLVAAGINPEYLLGLQAQSIQPASKRISQFLGNRMTREELERRNIVHKEQTQAQKVERISQFINPIFQQRKDKSALDQKILYGDLPENMANSIRGNAMNLNNALKKRRDSEDLFAQGILKGDYNDPMAMHKYYKAQEDKRMAIEKNLMNRMSPEEMQRRNLLQGQVNDNLAGTKHKMEFDMRKRRLSNALESRRNEFQIPEKYFQQPKRKRKKKKQNKRVSQFMRDAQEDLNVLYRERPEPHMVPMQYYEKADQAAERKAQLKKQLQKRQSAFDLSQRGILGAYELGHAHVDLQNHGRDDTETKNKLMEHFARRPSVADMQNKGYINTDIARSLQPNAKALENKLKRRMSVDDLAAKNILKGLGVSSRIAQQKEAVERDRMHRKLNGRLARRPSQADLVNLGYMQDMKGLSGQQLASRKELERKLLAQKLGNSLESRPDYHNINERYFHEANNAPSRNRTVSQYMKDSTAHMNQLFGNRQQMHEINENVFRPATKKRRMSAQMENNARTLESLLAHRPEKKDIEEDMWITAKDLRGSNGRRVSHAMHQMQGGLQNLLNSKKDHIDINERVFREPTMKERLQQQFEERATREQLMRQGIITDHAKRGGAHAGAAWDLEKRLARRQTLDQLQKNNVIDATFATSMSPSMVNQKRDLDWRMKHTKLDAAMAIRPDKSELADKGYLDDSGLAPALHGAALSLNLKMVNGRRASKVDLLNRGILHNMNANLSQQLIPAAHSLEKKLKRRMSIDNMAKRNIIDSKNRSARVLHAQNNLERNRRSSTIDNLLQHRPQYADLQRKGLVTKERVAPKLQNAAHGLAGKLKRRPSVADMDNLGYLLSRNTVTAGSHVDALEDHLATRSLPSDLKRAGIMSGLPLEKTLDDYKWISSREEYEQHAQQVREHEKQGRDDPKGQTNRMGKTRMRRMSNFLEGALKFRPGMSELADRGYLDDSGLAPALHPAALSVQQAMNNKMNRRQLIARGILPNHSSELSQNLAGRAHALNQHLRGRASLADMGAAGLLEDHVAYPDETRRQKRRRVSMALEHALGNRSTKEELAERLILDDSNLAPRLHGAAISLQSQLINRGQRDANYDSLVRKGIITADSGVARSLHNSRNALEGKLKRRQSINDVQKLGYLQNTKLSNNLAGAAQAISKNLKRRPSIDVLKARGIMNQYDTRNLPPEMIERAMKTQRDRKKQRINNLLASRPDRSEMDHYHHFAVEDMANSLQGAGREVSKMLKRRPSMDALQNRNILRGGRLPPEMQASAREMGFQSRRQTLNGFMAGQLKKKQQEESLDRLGLPKNIATTDDIKQVLQMNMALMGEIKNLTQQVNVLQMTCSSLVSDRDLWRQQMQAVGEMQQREISQMKEYMQEAVQKQSHLTPSTPVVQKERSNSFRAELTSFRDEFVNMQAKARDYLINERKQMAKKEAAMQAQMLESEIQVVRLQHEYEFTLSERPVGIKFVSTDNGRNLCVKAVKKGSQAERSGVMPGDVVINLRMADGQLRRFENQAATETHEVFRNAHMPFLVKLRKYEAHEHLKNLWRRKRDLLNSLPDEPQQGQAKAAEPGSTKHKRRDSNLFHAGDDVSNQQDVASRKREMQEALMHLKKAGNVDPIVRAFEEMDANQNGDLNQEEFVNGLIRIGLGDGLNASQMIHTFNMMDDDESGYIDFEEFEDFLKHTHRDPVLDLVQRHIRERISMFILSRQGRAERTQSQSHAEEQVRQQRAEMDERAQMMAMMEAQKKGVATHKRSHSAEGNAPRNWIEQMSEEDATRVQILAEQIGKILDSADSWQYAIRTVQKALPNLKLEIAKELYPLIQNRTIIERRDLTNRTLHIVDVLHAKLAPPEAKGRAHQDDPLQAQSIDNLVEMSRRMSTSQHASNHMAQLQARARMQQEEDDSSEEDYDFADQPPKRPPQSQQKKQQQQVQQSREQVVQLEHSQASDRVFEQFAMAQSMEKLYMDNEKSAFDDEEDENTNVTSGGMVEYTGNKVVDNNTRQTSGGMTEYTGNKVVQNTQVHSSGMMEYIPGNNNQMMNAQDIRFKDNAAMGKPIIPHRRRPSSSQRNAARGLDLTNQNSMEPPNNVHTGDAPPDLIDRRRSERLVASIPNASQKARGSQEFADPPSLNTDLADDNKRGPETPRSQADLSGKRGPLQVDVALQNNDSHGGDDLPSV